MDCTFIPRLQKVSERQLNKTNTLQYIQVDNKTVERDNTIPLIH